MVSEPEFLWVANHPALDFVNTELIRAGARTDLLVDFGRVLRWLEQADFLTGSDPAEAHERFSSARDRQMLVTRARELRAAVRALVESRGSGKRANAAALHTLNAVLELEAGHVQLASTTRGFARRYERALRDPGELLQPIASAATELLCDVDGSRIKACANHECILYFLDTSKNRTRRWCSMELCGNRTKVAAHYRRRRQRG